MTHRLTPAEALELLMRHADYQRDGGDRTEPVSTAIPGEVLAQCRRALEPAPEPIRAVTNIPEMIGMSVTIDGVDQPVDFINTGRDGCSEKI